MRPVDEAEQDTWGVLVLSNRKRLQMTQETLAERLGISVRTLSRWENGTARPETIAIARKAIRTLGIDPTAGLNASGYGDEAEAEADPYAYIRAMGLDPNGRVVRKILSLGLSERTLMNALLRERELQLRDEQRRIEDLEWGLTQQDAG